MPLGAGWPSVERAGRAAGDVEEPRVVDVQGLEQPVDPAEADLGEIGQRRAEVRRADRRQAEDEPGPLAREQGAGVEPAHAVADQVDRLVGERLADLPAQPFGPPRHPGDRRDLRDQDAIARRLQEVGDAAGSTRPSVTGPSADPGEAEEPVGQDDRRLQPGTSRGVTFQGLLPQARRTLRIPPLQTGDHCLVLPSQVPSQLCLRLCSLCNVRTHSFLTMNYSCESISRQPPERSNHLQKSEGANFADCSGSSQDHDQSHIITDQNHRRFSGPGKAR